MIYPLTKREAKKIRYGAWAGNPSGSPYNEKYCAYSVSDNFFRLRQCSRKNGYGPDGLYCRQHGSLFSESERIEVTPEITQDYEEEVVNDSEIENNSEVVNDSEIEIPILSPLDKHFLDEESLELETLYQKWSRLQEEWRENSEEWKIYLDNVVSSLDTHYRGNRANETAIKRAIELDARFISAQKSYYQATWNYKKIQTFLLSLEMRKKTIDNLIKLYAAQYFTLQRDSETSRASESYIRDIRKNRK